jgi:hypothetical protein
MHTQIHTYMHEYKHTYTYIYTHNSGKDNLKVLKNSYSFWDPIIQYLLTWALPIKISRCLCFCDVLGIGNPILHVLRYKPWIQQKYQRWWNSNIIVCLILPCTELFSNQSVTSLASPHKNGFYSLELLEFHQLGGMPIWTAPCVCEGYWSLNSGAC